MRVVQIEILGKEYDLTFSNRVLMRLEEEKLDTDTTKGSLTMLSAMMEAGDRLARMEGREGKGFLSVDDLADRLGPQDILELSQAMNAAQQGERNVETLDSSKKAGTPSEG